MIYISSNNGRHLLTKTYIPLHYTLPNHTSLHFTYTCWHFISSHLNFTQLHFTTIHYPLSWLHDKQLCSVRILAGRVTVSLYRLPPPSSSLKFGHIAELQTQNSPRILDIPTVLFPNATFFTLQHFTFNPAHVFQKDKWALPDTFVALTYLFRPVKRFSPHCTPPSLLTLSLKYSVIDLLPNRTASFLKPINRFLLLHWRRGIDCIIFVTPSEVG